MREQIIKSLMGAPKIYPTPPDWVTPDNWLKKALKEVRRVEEGEQDGEETR